MLWAATCELRMSNVQERRASPRRVVDCPGSIVGERSEAPQDCLIADISEGGVRLVVRGKVSDEFVLLINDGSDVRYKCRVVWRLDDEIGAEFA